MNNVKLGKAEDLTDLRFGRLTVLRPAYKKGYKIFWLCQCRCRGLTLVEGGNLRNSTRSCGCLQKELGKSIIRRAEDRQERMQEVAEIYLEEMMED